MNLFLESLDLIHRIAELLAQIDLGVIEVDNAEFLVLVVLGLLSKNELPVL